MKKTTPPDQRAVIRVIQAPLLEAMKQAIATLQQDCSTCTLHCLGADCSYEAVEILQKAIDQNNKEVGQ